MNGWTLAALGLIVVGLLMVVGIFAFLPQCGFGFNFILGNVCLAPITFFGLNPNFVAGTVLIGTGLLLGSYLHFEVES